ncbi:MAG: MFS transporter [Acidobacteriota bacterium]
MSGLRHAFRALRHRDFRVFFYGQAVSVTGTWMQSMAQAWLVYRLSGSPLVLGILWAVRFGPSLVLAPLAGVVADRFPRRSLVLATQAASLLQAAALAALTLSGTVRTWHVLLLALFQGVVDTLDMPARQTLQVDLVGVEDLQSAVSLNSSAFNLARMLGPALAGVLVAEFGEGVCFAANAVSYVAVLASLFALRVPPVAAAPSRSLASELLEGFRYALAETRIRRVLVAVTVISVLGMSYSSLLPVLAGDVLGAGARGYGLLLGGAGLGAILGALTAASRSSRGLPRGATALGQAALGASLIGLAVSASLPGAVSWLVAIGFVIAVQLSTTNAFLQTTAPPHLRGRIVSLYIWLFVGVSPLGGLAAGALAERAGVAWAIAAGGCGCLLGAALDAIGARRRGDAGCGGGE